MRHWFWHIIAMMATQDMYRSSVTEEEYEDYLHFMQQHGFRGTP